MKEKLRLAKFLQVIHIFGFMGSVTGEFHPPIHTFGLAIESMLLPLIATYFSAHAVGKQISKKKSYRDRLNASMQRLRRQFRPPLPSSGIRPQYIEQQIE